MNLFVLSLDPVVSARYLCDAHIRKMGIEAAQMLSNAIPEDLAPYKRAHYNHPVAKWVRFCKSNFLWTLEHAKEIFREFTFRYENDSHKTIGTLSKIEDLVSSIKFESDTGNIQPFYLSVPEFCIDADPVVAYRLYYLLDKTPIAYWDKGRSKPFWWKHFSSFLETKEFLLSLGDVDAAR